MTDIVERLRALGATNALGEPSMAHEAAAEIERLRAALRETSEMPWHLPLRAMMKLKMATAEFYGAPPPDQIMAQWWRDMWEAENDVR